VTTSAERSAALARYIQREVSKDPDQPLDLDTPLVSSGLVDSMSLISVLAFIEDAFGVVVPDEAATAASMNTVRLIMGLVTTYESPVGT
jgi:acyl carrier protein